MERSDVELILANRAFLYGVIARGFAEEPDDDFAAVLTSDHAREEVALVNDSSCDSLIPLYCDLLPMLSDPGARETAAQDYVRIFVGPNTLKADPWESVHVTGKRMLFQPNVLDVREAYREAGFASASTRRVSEDFIGTECDFMAKLAERALSLFQSGDDEASLEDLKRSRRFLRGHLLTWIDSLSCRIEENYPGSLYGALARFSGCVMRRDDRVLEEVCNWLSNRTRG